ncbi:ABC transporter permease [Prosthecomicrobium sp. N25]|uniref:ABC transporter permease n=1 Tax=Prosthecomicrobium sp. N25 TaxID=3129254 RepID=UPI0030782BEE
MWLYVARRILYAVPIALGVTVFCFALVYLAPGNPLQLLLPPDASAEVVELIKKTYGFDKPIPVQYATWLGRALTGDLGVSIATNRPVIGEVLGALSNTIILSLSAVMLAFSLAFTLGVVAAYFNGRWVDRTVTGFSIVGVSVPNYWLGMVLIIVFAVNMNWLPATGMGTKGSESFSLFDWEQLKHAILPVVTMSMIPLGIIMRTTRSAVAEVLNHDFVQTLRAKGLGEGAVVRHAVRNALPSVLAVMGLQFGYLMGGSILVETIFTWPGTGFLLNKAILTRDIPVLQGTILVLALIFVATNLVVDLVQTAVDPRIKRA